MLLVITIMSTLSSITNNSFFMGVEANCSASCTAGQYYDNSTSACVTCPSGHYCGSGSAAELCPPGKYNAKTNQTSITACLTCPSGQYNLFHGRGSCDVCPAGYTCTDPAASPVRCADGLWAPAGSTTCKTCPAGFACPTPTSDPQPCAAGSAEGSAGTRTTCTQCGPGYYATGVGNTVCTICPTGHRCPGNGATSPSACSSSRYAYPAGSTSCPKCPLGYSCTPTSSPPAICTNGTYAAQGDMTCTPCPQGTYAVGSGNGECTPCGSGYSCVNAGDSPSQCPAGTYSPYYHTACENCPSGTYSAAGASGCVDCPAGQYCPLTSGTPINCPAGSISYTNSTTCQSCSAGYYTDSNHQTCLPCPLGKQCPDPAAGPADCAAGFYADSTGTIQCTQCPEDHSCSDATVAPVACTNSYSVKGSTACQTCPLNYDCTNATSLTPCPNGKYSAVGAMTCEDCPAGSSCNSKTVPQPCGSNSYSALGDGECHICPAGASCSNSAIIGNCTLGTYSLEGESTCSPCPTGHECSDVTRPKLCPSGSHGAGDGTRTSCTQCTAGFYCPDPTTNAEIPCAAGTFSVAGQGSCSLCPPGSACPSQAGFSAVVCTQGTYSIGGQDACTPCPAGFYCNQNDQLPLACNPGTTSVVGSNNCTKCAAGYYCPDPADVPIICPVGTYSEAGWVACQPCDAGFTCSNGAVSPTDGTACPRGAYCLSAASQPTLCPAGTYNNLTSQKSLVEACQPCPAGYYCQAGTSDNYVACAPGFFCPSGTRLLDEFPCPAGTYNPNTGAITNNQCLQCLAGYYCDEGSTAIDYVNNICPAGYYCPNGTTHDRAFPCPEGSYNPNTGASDSTACLPCPAGSYCRVGATAASQCPEGTWSVNISATSASTCIPCPEGWACTVTGMTDPHVTPCAAGHYCPEGTRNTHAHPCPAGTYTTKTNLTRAEDCELCLQGYVCPRGSTSGTTTVCSAGYYCPGVSTLNPPTYWSSINAYGSIGGGSYYTVPGLASGESQFPCPAGTYNSQTGAISKNNCTQCPGGVFCPVATSAGIGSQPACAAGYYCPPGTGRADQFACPAGTYSSATNLTSSSECTPCPTGHFCRLHSSTPTECPAGSYSAITNTEDRGPTSDSAKKHCMFCPAGSFCGLNTTTPEPCPVGTFSDIEATSCSPCRAGHYCPTTGVSITAMLNTYKCPAGKYCPTGMSTYPGVSVEACGIGYYCPEATPLPIKCPVGTYNPSQNITSAAGCLTCDAGYYCVEGSTAVTGPCDAGFYCPAGSTGPKQVPCAAGTYRNQTTATAQSDCATCPCGSYCPPGTSTPQTCPYGHYCICGSGEPEPCPLGTFANVTSLKTAAECINCPPGQFCDGIGLEYPTGPCDPGYYCISGAYTSQPPGLPTGGLCPPGGYCILGSSTPESCPPGTFNNFTGAESDAECVACTPGYYCLGSNNPTPTGVCSPGYFCNGSAATPTQYVAPIGTYTPEGSAAPLLCADGTYNPSTGQSNCTPCAEGYYCTGYGLTQQTACNKGYYCPFGNNTVQQQCPPGTFNPLDQQGSLSACQACTGGKYCDQYAMTAVAGDCAAGHYCSSGSKVKFPVGNGADFGVCPEGHYCPNGTAVSTAFPCPVGHYGQGTGLRQESDCQACPAGHYCDVGGLTQVTVKKCASGYYCNTGSDTPKPTVASKGGVCPPGTYCEPGSITPTICPDKYYQNLAAQNSCIICPAGYYCGASNGTAVPATCPAGFYCPEGTGAVVPSCPAGTYSSNQSLALQNVSQCTNCPGGYFCGTPGLHTPTGKCTEGFYCTSGAIDALATAFSVFGGAGGRCTPGHYCPAGSILPTACPIGTYSPSNASVDVSACLQCPPGKYCATTGLSAPTGLCDAGYYCVNNATSATPTDGTKGDICPQGKMCPQGSVAPLPCPAGSFQNAQQKSSCSVCPAGYYCPDGVSGTINPIICPQGYYCPENTTSFRPACPAGTFSNTTGLSKSTDCTLCLAGKVCSVAGLTAPDGECLQGYYCTSGAKTQTGVAGVNGGSGGPCPQGHYCATGSSIPITCPIGTFSNSTLNIALSSCVACTPGSYCSATGLSAVSGSCAERCYCPQSSNSSCPALCPTGHYCPPGQGVPIPCGIGYYAAVSGQSNCTICPAGKLCDALGISSLKDCPAGSYCPIGTPLLTNDTVPKCNLGTFSNVTSLTEQSQCQQCIGGHYCETKGLTTPTGKCFQGYFCTSGAMDGKGTAGPTAVGPTSGGECPQGQYCPLGSSVGINCPAGTFSISKKLSQSSECTSCTQGSYCELTGLTSVTAQCSEGYYCPPGQSVAAPASYICPPGHYCPTGSIQPTPCPAGNYTYINGSSTCTACPQGKWCDVGTVTPAPCPTNFYCPLGVNSPITCPNGTYGNTTGLSDSKECVLCPASKYCINGRIAGSCDAGYFCNSGSGTPTPTYVAPGTSCSPGCLCPAGHYCPAGTNTPVKCPDGKYSPGDGASTAQSCGACPAGYLCLADAQTPCSIGYYCPGGNRSLEYPCPIGTYNDLRQQADYSSCKPCPAGYICNEAGIGLGNVTNCPPGHFCVQGSVTPAACPAGTFRASPNGVSNSSCFTCPAGYYCGKQSITGSPCVTNASAPIFCESGSSVPTDCKPGFYCSQSPRSESATICPAGFYCPAKTYTPIPCSVGHYCPQGSSSPTPCARGYRARSSVETTSRKTLDEACGLCPAGFYGDGSTCQQCAEGYYCKQGATHPTSQDVLSKNVFICPAGFKCLNQSSTPSACPKGSYQPSTGQTSCLQCRANTYASSIASTACSLCGPSAFSAAGADTCQCTGTGRSYQISDGMCICKPGYIFYNEDFSISNDSDATSDCQPYIYDRCSSGDFTSRDIVGNCVNKNGESCKTKCAALGQAGTVTDYGFCECSEIQNINLVCNQTCRDAELRLKMNVISKTIDIYDPSVSTTTPIRTYPISRISAGTVNCVREDGCQMVPVQMQDNGFVGLYNPGMNYYENLLNYTGLSTLELFEPNFATKDDETEGDAIQAFIRRKKRTVTATANSQHINVEGILRPVVCLPYGGSIMWDISHPSRAHYPQYMKDALVNTVENFDYGPFRRLDGLMRSQNYTPPTFSYAFTTPGIYVFQDATDTNKVMVVRVLPADGKCPSTNTAFNPLSTTSLSTVGVATPSNLVLAPDWLLVMLLLGGFLGFILFLILGVHCFRTQRWKAASNLKPAFRSVVPLSEIESKGIGFSQRQLYTTKAENDAAIVDDDRDVVDLEGFSLSLFYQKLGDNSKAIDQNMKGYLDEFQEKYDKIIEETNEIKDILSRKQTVRVDIESNMNRLTNVKNVDGASNALVELQQQRKKLLDDQANKQPFDHKNSTFDSETIKKLYKLDNAEVQHRNASITEYNLLIARLGDIEEDLKAASERGDGNEEELQELLDRYNKTIASTKIVLQGSLEAMNDAINGKDKIQREESSEANINLDADMATALKNFMNVQLTQMWNKFMNPTAAGSGLGEDEDADENNNEEKNEEETEAYADSETESEPDSDDENDSDLTKLKKEQQRKRIELHHHRKAEVVDLEEELEQEFQQRNEDLENTFKKHQEETMNKMRENMQQRIRNADSDERDSIMREMTKAMEDQNKALEDELEKQKKALAQQLKSKRARKLSLLRDEHNRQKQDLTQDQEQDLSSYKRLLDKLDGEKDKYSDAREMLIEKQKQLFGLRLELNQKKNKRQRDNNAIALDKQLSAEESIDKELHDKDMNKLHRTLLELRKKEFEKMLVNDRETPKDEKLKLKQKYAKEMEAYKKHLESQRRHADEELEKKLKKRREDRKRDLDHLHSHEEQQDIERQEKDLEAMKRLMGGVDHEASALEAKLESEKQRQAAELQKRLRKLKESQKKKEKEYAAKEGDVDTALDKEFEKKKAALEAEHNNKLAEFKASKKKELDQQLNDADDEDAQSKLLSDFDAACDNYTEHLNELKKHQLSDLEANIAEKKRKLKERLAEHRRRELSKQLEQQEAMFDRVAPATSDSGDGPKVTIDDAEKKREQELADRQADELKQIKKNLEDSTDSQLEEYTEELNNSHEEELKEMEREAERKKALLRSQAELQAAEDSSNKEKIFADFESNMSAFEKQQAEQKARQEEAFKAKMAKAKQRLKKRQQIAIEEKKLEHENEQEALARSHRAKAEKKVILDMITDNSSSVRSIQDAIDRVVIPRQQKEVAVLEKRLTREETLLKEKIAHEPNKVKRKKYTVQLQEIVIIHRRKKLDLKSNHLKERQALKLHFKEYEQLIQNRNKENKDLSAELQSFADKINQQKQENLAKIEAQKAELKAKMDVELAKLKDEMDREKAKMAKMLEDEKNKLSVNQQIEEQEAAHRALLEQQKNLEKDERTKLLHQHKLSMQQFETALEAERKRQEDILASRIQSHIEAQHKQKEVEHRQNIDEQFNNRVEAKKKKVQMAAVTNKLRAAKNTASLISLIDERGVKRTKDVEGKVTQNVLLKKTTSTVYDVKLSQENAWLGPIYQKLKNIEALLLADKKPYMDPRDERTRNEGSLSQLAPEKLNLNQFVFYKFAEFVIRLLHTKFPREIPQVRLLIARSLPLTEKYDNNAFKNSYHYDIGNQTLFIRDTRLTSIGKLCIIVAHALAHIAIKDMGNDQHPLFTGVFYKIMEVVCEDVFYSRVPMARLKKAQNEPRASIGDDIAKFEVREGTTKYPHGLFERRRATGPVKADGNRSMMNKIASQGPANTQKAGIEKKKQLQAARALYVKITKEKGADSDEAKKQKQVVLNIMGELKKLAEIQRKQREAAKGSK